MLMNALLRSEPDALASVRAERSDAAQVKALVLRDDEDGRVGAVQRLASIAPPDRTIGIAHHAQCRKPGLHHAVGPVLQSKIHNNGTMLTSARPYHAAAHSYIMHRSEWPGLGNGQRRLSGSPLENAFPIAPGPYLALRHRNHLAVMSAAPQRLDANEAGLDFTLVSTPAYGLQAQATLSNARMALWCGDVNRDGTLKYVGSGNDRDPILQAIGGTLPSATLSPT